jgi:hypothetical protein
MFAGDCHASVVRLLRRRRSSACLQTEECVWCHVLCWSPRTTQRAGEVAKG